MEKLKTKHAAELKRFAEQKKNIHRLWNVPESTAHLLYMLISAKSPNNILEIGTSNGYSTFWLSLAAEKQESQVYSIEVDEERYQLAQQNLAKRRNIQLFNGMAEAIIPRLKVKFDLVFIDAGKVNYIDYIRLLLPKLAENAMIIADNVISHSETVREYLDFIKTNDYFSSITLNIDSGLEISIYKKEK